MSNLSDNPFASLFSAPAVVQSSEKLVQHDDEPEEEETPPEPNPVHLEAPAEQNEPNSDSAFNEVMQQVFRITLQNDGSDLQSDAIFLENLAGAVHPRTLFSTDLVDQAILERLMIEDPNQYIVRPPVRRLSGATEPKALVYLYDCYKRLLRFSGPVFEQLSNSLFDNVALCLGEPELFGGEATLGLQLYDLLKSCIQYEREFSKFINNSMKKLQSRQDPCYEVFNEVLRCLILDVKCISLFMPADNVFSVIRYFAASPILSELLIRQCTPADRKRGVAYEDTILGHLLSISCLPKNSQGTYEYFTKPFADSVQSHKNLENYLQGGLEKHWTECHGIFHSLMKASPKSKHLTLTWLAECLIANEGRGKLWQSHMMNPILDAATVGDGFGINLSSLMLLFSEPFCCSIPNNKLEKIDASYTQCPPLSAEQQQLQGVHLSGLKKETCLQSNDEEDQALPEISQSFTFITECFFMTHKAIVIGARVVQDKLFRLHQELARTQQAYQETLDSGAPSDVLEPMKARLEEATTKYLSIKAVLLTRCNLNMCLRFFVASATWLVQQSEETAVKNVKFPLPLTASKKLSFIPEFIVENITDFLTFLRRFHPATFEEGGEYLPQLFTFVLVFMGSPERMKNPHLRARLAECLEALMPHSESPLEQNGMFGSIHRNKLFLEHVHKDQIVASLLHVFVSIEMTGQSVQFEQKFEYRRPMYIVMDYLWGLREHRIRFKKLSTEAESNMEATNPPLFLRFVNLLINDAIFLLDEGLNYMKKIKELQHSKDSGEWNELPVQQRHQNQANLHHMGMLARFHNLMGIETIKTLRFLTSDIQGIFVHKTIVDRVASMLNYFLYCLVGPKNKEFKVKDLKEFDFRPADLVTDICRIYCQLYTVDAFCLAVSGDSRSYSPLLFQQAQNVLSKIGQGMLISDVQLVADKVNKLSEYQKIEEEMLQGAPEEFLDPIISCLMTDPVILPSSNVVIDRNTIARHLLSDQTDPFNRSPLSLEMVTPDLELKIRIDQWLEEKRKEIRTKIEQEQEMVAKHEPHIPN